jgi:hypothetical protein
VENHVPPCIPPSLRTGGREQLFYYPSLPHRSTLRWTVYSFMKREREREKERSTKKKNAKRKASEMNRNE